MEVLAIRSEAAYRAMLTEVSALVDLDPHPDSPEGERFDQFMRRIMPGEDWKTS